MRPILCLIYLLCCALSVSAADRYLGSAVGVDADGNIIPPGAAVTISDLSRLAASQDVVTVTAEGIGLASADASNRIDLVEGKIATQQQHGIFRMFTLSFSSTVAPVTSATVQVVGFTRRAEGTNEVADIFTWMDHAPTNAPVIDWRARLSTGSWTYLSPLSNSWPATVPIVTTGGVYDAYQTTVIVPAAQTTAFYRVNGSFYFTDGLSDALPVTGGIKINGKPGITTNRVINGVTNRWEWGVLVP